MLTELRAECSNCPPSLFRVYVPSRCYVVHSRSVNLTVSLWLLDLQLTLEIPRSLPISCLFAAELAWDGELLRLTTGGGSISLPNLLPGATFMRMT